MYKKLLITFLLIFLVQLSFIKVIDKAGSEHLDNALVRSLTVFAIARGLNGLISVVQGTEIYATPAGVGVNFAVGQIVDPMNDMLERFSWVMLMSSVSLGIQKLLLELGQTEVFQALLALSAMVLLFILWVPKLWHKQSFNLIFKSFIIFSFLRFLIPLIVLMNEGIYTYAFESQYEEAEKSLSYSQEEISQVIQKVKAIEEASKSVPSSPTKGLWNQTRHYFNDLGESFNFKKYYQSLQDEVEKVLLNLKNKFDEAINNMLSLISIFIMQSILLPLLSLWLFIKLFQGFIKKDISEFFENKTS
ncbi:MAG: hypothetical protein COA44_06765 [Arcobacter sp.]|nr:MAG: hypothetical protein COA44_06765 [Arcobacter sp.]